MEEMNYDIANALYLASEKLGKKYEEERETPLDENFALTDGFIREVLKGANAKNNIEQSEFLKNGNKTVSVNFENALSNTQEVIEGLSSKLFSGEFAVSMTDNIETEVKQVIDILKIRKKLLEIALIELKNKRTDSFGLYKDIQGLSETVNEIMANSYEEKLEKDIIIERFIAKCREENQRNKMLNAQALARARMAEMQNNLESEKQQVKEQVSEKTVEKVIPNRPPMPVQEDKQMAQQEDLSAGIEF